MNQLESNFLDICKGYDNDESRDYKGSLLFKAYDSEKFGEELLAAYVTVKQKFDCLYAFLLTKSRIIEISSYSTMYISTSKKYSAIKKVSLEQAFDSREVENLLGNDAVPERLQVKVQFVDFDGQTEEYSWENVEDKEKIVQIIDFAQRLKQVQAGL